ncbi:MAG: hypothetical protein FWG21_05505 [Oscillospiraceae bacterium]|nr:hypothetical protein [Oscillospiraceae bacterium]
MENPEYGLNLWLILLNAETEEDLIRIETLGDTTMNQTIEVYRQISVSEELRSIELMREKAHFDEGHASRTAEIITTNEFNVSLSF